MTTRDKRASWFFGWKQNAGLLCVAWRGYSLHFIVQRSDWVWGYERGWYDTPLWAVGAGPLFALTWIDVG